MYNLHAWVMNFLEVLDINSPTSAFKWVLSRMATYFHKSNKASQISEQTKRQSNKLFIRVWRLLKFKCRKERVNVGVERISLKKKSSTWKLLLSCTDLHLKRRSRCYPSLPISYLKSFWWISQWNLMERIISSQLITTDTILFIHLQYLSMSVKLFHGFSWSMTIYNGTKC